MKRFKSVFILATLATLWLTPITSVTGHGDQAGIAYAGTIPNDPPFDDQDTTVTPPPPSASEPAPEDATVSTTSLTDIIVDYFMSLLS